MNAYEPQLEAHQRAIQEDIREMKPMLWAASRHGSEIESRLLMGVRVDTGWLPLMTAIIIIEGAVIISLLAKLALH